MCSIIWKCNMWMLHSFSLQVWIIRTGKEKRVRRKLNMYNVHSAQIFRTFINNKDSILSNPCIYTIYNWYHKLIEESTHFAFGLWAWAPNTHFDLFQFMFCAVHIHYALYILFPLYSHYPKRKDRKNGFFLYHQLRVHRKVRLNKLEERNRENEQKRLKTYCKCTKQHEYANFGIVHHRKGVELLVFARRESFVTLFFFCL